MIPRVVVRPLVLLAVLASSWISVALARGPSELSNSFIITSLQDLDPTSIRGVSLTPCEYAVARARGLGQKHFSIVVTAYWAGGKAGVWHYSLKDCGGYRDCPYGPKFIEPTAANLESWKYALQARARVLGLGRSEALYVEVLKCGIMWPLGLLSPAAFQNAPLPAVPHHPPPTHPHRNASRRQLTQASLRCRSSTTLTRRTTQSGATSSTSTPRPSTGATPMRTWSCGQRLMRSGRSSSPTQRLASSWLGVA